MNKVSILLVEDNHPDVFLVRRALTQAGIEYDLLVAEDGERAKTLIQTLGRDLPCPDIALIDLNMPKAQGHELIGIFRQQCGAAPVIVCTSSDSPDDRRAAVELQVDAYFRKPITLDEFMELGVLVRDILQRQPEHTHTAAE
jgi:CheY-like chemotaxis protein